MRTKLICVSWNRDITLFSISNPAPAPANTPGTSTTNTPQRTSTRTTNNPPAGPSTTKTTQRTSTHTSSSQPGPSNTNAPGRISTRTTSNPPGPSDTNTPHRASGHTPRNAHGASNRNAPQLAPQRSGGGSSSSRLPNLLPTPSQPPASKWVTFFILELSQVPCLMGVIHYSSTETTTARFATYVISDLVTSLV